ncbi:phage tail protein [Azohydromonas lata]|uniref:Phage tail protein n=1 Tax=Azohydromonas lata TaxID=45677 RepID=A0ABU5ID13_9BURK|nr:phage tail protein [Azohydromonas lata]MDZ5457006.1 phage tail protein [Azohydromonas lata]
MEKLRSLRDALTAAVPEIARDPSKLTVFAKAGTSVATGAGERISWEYRYTATLLLLDFAGNADHVIAAVHAWVRVYQVELLDNLDLRARGIQFEAELLNTAAVDLQITLQLTEGVRVLPRAGAPATGPAAQRWEITHLAEPPRLG